MSAPRGADDERPGFAPASVIMAVQRLLAAQGVQVDPDPGMLHVASIAAADLLRALGVRPEIAPIRRQS